MHRKVLAGLVFGACGLALLWGLSPWPSLIFYRTVMDADGAAANIMASIHAPDDIVTLRDLVYKPDDPSARLDVYKPHREQHDALPVVVWVHGGGYLSGDKDHIANYLKILAGNGFATIGVNYRLAPEVQYPEPVRDVALAIGYVRQHAAELGIDTNRMVLAGDSAGAQIAAQLAIAIVSPSYAASLQLKSPMDRQSLRGAVLFCGLYDPDLKDNASEYGSFLSTATWAYFGVDDLSKDPRKRQFSVVANLPATMPPLFVSAGNEDPLLGHSKKLVAVAQAKGVHVRPLFFDGHKVGLGHEYQFDLSTPEARQALSQVVHFIRRVEKPARSTAMR